ncbi:MAG: ferrochelatase [Pirellulales bacterium]
MKQPYDAILVVSFGAPDKPQDVLPFLENVVRGKNVPHERLVQVAERYHRYGGASPLGEQTRALVKALTEALAARGPRLPVYAGNRNWHPLLGDTLRQMATDGVHRALAFITASFGSYPSCRQYLEDIQRARQAVGPSAPEVDKLRAYYNHPGFVGPVIEAARAAIEQLPPEKHSSATLVFTAHSIPVAMARTSPYESQLRESCRLVAEGLGRADWHLVYQSRSGPPSQPWLEPDIRDFLRKLPAKTAVRDVVVVPIGFLSDHLEVLYDLDTAARKVCDEVGLSMVRAATVGNHPRFIAMIRELILERMEANPTRRALGALGPSPDVCPPECCPAPGTHSA